MNVLHYFYNSFGKGFDPKTRHPLEKFLDVLNDYLVKYTDSKLDKMRLRYSPRRTNERERFSWMFEEGDECGSGLETDEEVIKTLEYIHNLNIITENHEEKTFTADGGWFDEKHEYEIDINSYPELFNFIKLKRQTCYSTFHIAIDCEFNFIDYNNFSDMHKELKKYCSLENKISFWINSMRNKFSKKIYHSIGLQLTLPDLTDKEKNFLRETEKLLKINFSPNGFWYSYETKKGGMHSEKSVLACKRICTQMAECYRTCP